MATREQIGGTDAPPRDATPSQAELGSAGAAPGTEIIYGAFAPGWWRHLFKRPRREPAPGTEIVYTAFAPGWWRYLFRRTPRRSPK